MTTMIDPTDGVAPETGATPPPRSGRLSMWRLLLRDRMATVALVVLVLIVLSTVGGSLILGDKSNDQDLARGAIAPFSLDHGWLYVLGSDKLGRSMIARMVVGGRTTLAVAVPAVLISLVIGSLIGMWAGYHRGWRETVAMRVADVIMSFPSLLMAVVVLYVFSPSASMIVVVLAITRIPIYLRTARAESAELQSRTFVDAARTFGTRPTAIIRRHVFPIVLPTLLTVATLDFCYVMLAESSLSFLGIGIQPPGVSWGLMVSQGRQYLQTAWWLSFFPGLAIVVTAVCSTLLASWVRIATDPSQRWRLTVPRKAAARRRRQAPIVEGEVS
ncbi:peptide/nickel transport system permease protein [Nocardioides terrae]|uniref:Peptide/nickel transport system permease protein n=1 Tax=Nocardioides terrae TaxID=574651 RepID=A0A1I1KFA2_9ACTN|nr:ABC transporter permease [Nocardioides terrae]SFC59205.1 peptide/nickel transport system permease protein [Nocardioides terrae]